MTGAGDTVIGVLAAALAAGDSLEEACFLANAAAGVVVGKLGTSTVSKIGDQLGAARHNFLFVFAFTDHGFKFREVRRE